jgi:hypothetical protein
LNKNSRLEKPFIPHIGVPEGWLWIEALKFTKNINAGIELQIKNFSISVLYFYFKRSFS